MQLLKSYEAYIKFFNTEEEEEIFNLFAIRDEFLKMELSEKDREKLQRLEKEFKKLLLQIGRKYPAMFRAFIKGERVEPQGVSWKILG